MTRVAYLFLAFFVFVIPWQQVVRIEGVGTIARLAGLAAFAVAIIATASSGRFRPLTLFHVWAIGFVMWSGITLFWTVDSDATTARFARNVQLAGLLWMVWELAATHERRMGLFQAYVLGAYVSALHIVVNYILGNPLVSRGGYQRPRFAPTGFNPNDIAFLLVLALPMAWHLSTVHGKPWVRWLNRVYLLVAVLAILLTGSRSGLLLTPVALLIVPWTLPRLGLGMKVGMLLVLGASVTIAWKYVSEASWARLATTRAELAEGSLNERRVIWQAGIRLFPLHPVGGVGAGAFERAVIPFLGYKKTAHNAYLAVLIDHGIVGLTLFLLMFASVFLHVRSAPPRERRFFLVLLLTLCAGLAPRTWEDEKQTWLILALLLAPAATSQPAVAAAPRARGASPPALEPPPGTRRARRRNETRPGT